MKELEVSLGQQDRHQVINLLRKAGLSFKQTGRANSQISIIYSNKSAYHGIEGAEFIVEQRKRAYSHSTNIGNLGYA